MLCVAGDGSLDVVSGVLKGTRFTAHALSADNSAAGVQPIVDPEPPASGFG